MNVTYNVDYLKKLFTKANERLVLEDIDLLMDDVSERAICGALKCYLGNELAKESITNYFVDVEYNRNKGKLKTIVNSQSKIISITCDLIIHSRGKCVALDNLLAIEMKKKKNTKRYLENKQKDVDRLITLTKTTYDNVWSADGKALPEHVCGYILGIFYELDIQRRQINLEYYSMGALIGRNSINLTMQAEEQS